MSDPLVPEACYLTKREYYAAMAIQGAAISNWNPTPDTLRNLSMAAVKIADALIAELDK